MDVEAHQTVHCCTLRRMTTNTAIIRRRGIVACIVQWSDHRLALDRAPTTCCMQVSDQSSGSGRGHVSHAVSGLTGRSGSGGHRHERRK